jgi:hypothetical protein
MNGFRSRHSLSDWQFLPRTTEGHELDRKWRVLKAMIGRRLSQEEAKKLLVSWDEGHMPQNTGGSRMMPVPKYMAKSGAIHKNQIKAASRNATMHAPINASSCVRRSRHHCNLLGIYLPVQRQVVSLALFLSASP